MLLDSINKEKGAESILNIVLTKIETDLTGSTYKEKPVEKLVGFQNFFIFLQSLWKNRTSNVQIFPKKPTSLWTVFFLFTLVFLRKLSFFSASSQYKGDYLNAYWAINFHSTLETRERGGDTVTRTSFRFFPKGHISPEVA